MENESGIDSIFGNIKFGLEVSRDVPISATANQSVRPMVQDRNVPLAADHDWSCDCLVPTVIQMNRRIFRPLVYLIITATIISNLYNAFAGTKQPHDLNVGSSQSGVQRISSYSDDRPLLQRAPKVERPSDDQLTPRDRLTHNIDSVASCTANQLETILKQLPADDCEANSHKPYNQRCSFTYATKCPDNVWLEEYYTELHSNEHTEDQTNNKFVGIFVGCNKGFDAVNALRMGSGNAFFSKDSWKEAMVNNSGVKEGDCGVCKFSLL